MKLFAILFNAPHHTQPADSSGLVLSELFSLEDLLRKHKEWAEVISMLTFLCVS